MRCALVLLMLFAPLLAQEPAQETAPPAPDEQEWLHKEVGLEQMFRHPPEPFMSLQFTHVDTVKVNGADKVRYSISAAGLKAGVHYSFMAWKLGDTAPQLMLSAVQVDKRGVLRCDPEAKDCPGQPGSEVNVAVSDNPGQPSRFVIAGEDEQPVALGEIIPSPKVVADHDCSLETVLLRPDATIVLVVGTGFVAGEPIKVISTSFDDHLATGGNANANGEYQSVILPFAKDHDRGETTVTMNSARCELSTEFHWETKPEEVTPTPPVPPADSSPAPEPKPNPAPEDAAPPSLEPKPQSPPAR